MSACEAGSARDAHTKAPYPVLHSAQRHRIEGRPRTRPSIPSRKKPLSISSFLIPSRLVMSRLSVRLRPCRLTPPYSLPISCHFLCPPSCCFDMPPPLQLGISIPVYGSENIDKLVIDPESGYRACGGEGWRKVCK